ncbi:MAG: hypothetical protein ACK58N_15400 [Synechocystis sp.]
MPLPAAAMVKLAPPIEELSGLVREMLLGAPPVLTEPPTGVEVVQLTTA